MNAETIASDWAGRWALYNGNKPALVDLSTQETRTYGQWHLDGEYLASYLFSIGVEKGDRLAVLSTFNLTYFGLFSAAQKLGFVLVPLNYRLNPSEIAYQVEHAEVKWAFYEETFFNLTDGSSKWVPISSLGKERIMRAFPKAVLSECDPIFILYTSGTTGFPKGAIYTHGMLLWNSLNTALRLQVHASDRTLMVMPPFHTGGWNVLTTPLLHFGATVYFTSKFEANRVVDWLESEEISLFMAVPTMVRMLSEAPSFEQSGFKHLRYFIVGGEPLALDLIETWAKKEVPIRQGYGLTEAGPNITSLSERDAYRKRGSIGHPNFYVETRIVKEDGNLAEANERGELQIKGKVVSPGYWKQEEATLKAFDDSNWFKTGDVLTRDEEGFLYVVDRLKNMFISGGENVYPAEIERVLLSHPEVQEVAIVPVYDAKWGEVGVAFYVGTNTIKAEDLREFAARHLARFKIPKYYFPIETMPLGDTGKINRKQLAKEASKLLGR